MYILVVEDDPKVARFLRRGLEEQSFTVDTAFTGPEAEGLLEEKNYDLVILDVMLPGKDGISLCKELRKSGNGVPVLVVSARDRVRDRIIGLDSGADDYIVKPFDFKELLARVRALLRRGPSSYLAPIEHGDISLNPLERKVLAREMVIELTNREFGLLEHLLRSAGRVVPRTELLERVWGMNYDPGTNVVDVHITSLRNKIDKRIGKALIETVRGVGYIIRK